MTYSSGSLIEATDYNGFASTTSGANVNATWNTAYGQTALTTVAAAAQVTATQWATLNTTITSMGAHQGTALTSRTNPTVGDTISILSNLNTDITNCFTNRRNAASAGSQYTAWTGSASKTTSTGSGTNPWTITFTDTITFGSALQAGYFFNAGGRIQIQFGKSSTGTVADTQWNSFIGILGTIVLTSDGSSKTIGGTSYTGTTRIGGSGTPSTLATSVGYNQLTGTPTTLFQQSDTVATYTDNNVSVTASMSGFILTITTVWTAGGGASTGSTDVITGGTASSGISFGTAPSTIVTYFPPSIDNLTNTWGTPLVASTVS
jgi:hypothetical protein